MALLKRGVRYPVAIVSSYTYKCPACGFTKTFVEASSEKLDVCSECGCSLRLVSSQTETKPRK